MPATSHQTASKLAQLLGEVIVHHAPWSAKLSEEARRQVTNEWLDRLEAHSAEIVGPLIERVLATTEVPEELRPLLDNAKAPSAAFGSLAQQFLIFGIGMSVGSQIVQPFLAVLAEQVWQGAVDSGLTLPLPPPDIARMVVRGLSLGGPGITPLPGWAATEAKNSGFDHPHIQALVDSVGNPPSPQELFEMFRRGIIDIPGMEQGLREGDTRDEWIANYVKLAHTWPSPLDFVRAAVQEQIGDYGVGSGYANAKAWAKATGLDTDTTVDGSQDMFDLLFHISGRPPGPVETGQAANRGYVPWAGTGPEATTFEQAIAESDVKTKWTPVLRALAAYVPTPSEARELYMRGGIGADEARAYMEMHGVASTLADAIMATAEQEQIDQDKLLVKGDIEQLVQEGVIDDTVAVDLLGQVGYVGESAQLLIEMAHFRWNLAILRRSVESIAGFYTSHRVTATQATQALGSLGLPRAQVDKIMTTLTTERNAVVQIPTAAQIVDGQHYGVISYDTALNLLMQLGYGEWDAWLMMSVRDHQPLPNEPPMPATIQSA